MCPPFLLPRRFFSHWLVVAWCSAVVGMDVHVHADALLAHRYSFSESGGSTVTDAVGGPAWNGVLPNGGTFSNGEVVCLAASQQYVQLPTGILGDAAATTIEAWVTFPNALPTACFFFGFGNISGNTGYNYIFCQPRDGRVTISDWHWSGEQTATGAGNQSFRSNVHLVAVFNPPAGQIALYTNGVLAAVNNSVTIPMTSVFDVYNFIGRSLYSGDSYFNFNLNEFRIYEGALTPAQIQDNYAFGPDVATFAGPVQFMAQPQSATVNELAPVAFTAEFAGTPVVGIQWRRNGANIPGATNAAYAIPNAAMTNNGAAFSVVLTNAHLGTNHTVIQSVIIKCAC